MRYAMLVPSLLLAVCARAVPAQLHVTKLEGRVTVDGDLSDAAWRHARRIDSLVECFRGDNTAPPAKTIGYLAYDDAAVYAAFLAADPAPSSIRAPLVDRDKVLGD